MQNVARLATALALLLLWGCVSVPDGVVPVQNFDINRYAGTWYEIARLDHAFERDLEQVTAQYTVQEDGGVQVINRGLSARSGAWEEAQGKAYFVNAPSEAYLKVSFFGPFYGAYIVFELDERDYQYAFVSGPDKSYLWLLSRSPQIDVALKQRFIAQASRLGFDTDQLIFPTQTP